MPRYASNRVEPRERSDKMGFVTFERRPNALVEAENPQEAEILVRDILALDPGVVINGVTYPRTLITAHSGPMMPCPPLGEPKRWSR